MNEISPILKSLTVYTVLFYKLNAMFLLKFQSLSHFIRNSITFPDFVNTLVMKLSL